MDIVWLKNKKEKALGRSFIMELELNPGQDWLALPMDRVSSGPPNGPALESLSDTPSPRLF